MLRFLVLANDGLFLYYLGSNLIYLALLIVALRTSARHHRELKSQPPEWIRSSPLAPPITLLIPAHNEEKSIRTSIRSFLSLDYPELEVIVINDGSKDGTLRELNDEFGLRPVNAIYVAQVKSAPVRALYRSTRDPRLVVVDKEAGGSKADANNAGLNAATSPYVCVLDADSILESDALLRIMRTMLADAQRMVAAGGIVRVLNGSEFENGRMTRVRLPKKASKLSRWWSICARS